MSSVARLYSQTLYDLEGEAALDICWLQRALDEQSLSFFDSSFVSIEQKTKAIDKLPFSEKIKGFLYQLTLKKRWSYLEQICLQLEKLVEEKKGIIKGVIYTSGELKEDQKGKIEKALSSYFKGKKVLLKAQKQEGLLSGIRVEVEGMKWDDSTLYHLKNFKAKVRGL